MEFKELIINSINAILKLTQQLKPKTLEIELKKNGFTANLVELYKDIRPLRS